MSCSHWRIPDYKESKWSVAETLASFGWCSHEMLRAFWNSGARCCGSRSLGATPGCDPTRLNGGAAVRAPHLSCRSSKGGFILGILRKMQSLCIRYSRVSRSAPASCEAALGWGAVLCFHLWFPTCWLVSQSTGCEGLGSCTQPPVWK